MREHKVQLFCVLAILFPLAASGAVIAKVGKYRITEKEYHRRYKEVLEQVVNAPSPQQFLEDLIRYKMGLQEAEKLKVEKDPRVQEQIDQVIYKGLLEKAVGPAIEKISVNEREMKAFYRKYPEIRTRHILIEFKPDSTPAQIKKAKKRAEEIYSEIKKSRRPFKDLVKLYTDDVSTRDRGGDIGWQTRLTLVPEYYDAALRMKNNEVKGLVRTKYGFHIIKMEGKKGYGQANKVQIRAAVYDLKRKEILDKYFGQLKKQYKIEVNEKLVK